MNDDLKPCVEVACPPVEEARLEMVADDTLGYANYTGDHRATFDDTRPYGPGMDGKYRWAVSAEYDEETNTTKVGFSKIPPGARDLM